jgi:SanA protein
MRTKLLVVFVAILLLCLLIYVCNTAIENSTKGRLFSDVTKVPYNKVGLLLGTSKYSKKGYTNLFYKYRIDAAAQLYTAGKVKYIIISGDNSTKNYNEPQMMKDDLILHGVDSSHIYLDYAGFRTFDSIVRLKEVFGQDSVTIISQPFHNERAIYLASREGVTAVGFNAKDVNQSAGVRTRFREKFARVKVFLDYMFGKKPKFLGNKIIIPE